MRKILFRGKAINRKEGYEYRTKYKNGDWVYGVISNFYHERFPLLPLEMTNEDGVQHIEVDYKTVGQYTGLKDKNGKKIFEGDIVKHYGKSLAGEPVGDVGVVTWDCDECFFFRTSLSGKDKTISRHDTLKVIGNIHDNPELLEVEK